MKLPEDLQRILNVGAKVYNTQTKKQGKVTDVSDSQVSVTNTDGGAYSVVRSEFEKMLIDDHIVSNSRLTIGSGNLFKVRPREGSPVEVKSVSKPEIKAEVKDEPEVESKPSDLEEAYINEKTGRFSKTKKKGYIKIEYRKATQKLTLEIDDEQLAKLKEMGLV